MAPTDYSDNLHPGTIKHFRELEEEWRPVRGYVESHFSLKRDDCGTPEQTNMLMEIIKNQRGRKPGFYVTLLPEPLVALGDMGPYGTLARTIAVYNKAQEECAKHGLELLTDQEFPDSPELRDENLLVIGKRDGDYAATVTSVLDAYFAIRPLFDPETPVPPIGNAMKRS